MPVFLNEFFTLIWGSLVNASLQVAFLAIFAFLALRLLSRSSAALRHQLLVVTLFCGMLMPLLNLYQTGKFFASNQSSDRFVRSNLSSRLRNLEADMFTSEKPTKGHPFEDLRMDDSRTSGSNSEMLTSSKPFFAKMPLSNWSMELNAVFFGTHVRSGLVCL